MRRQPRHLDFMPISKRTSVIAAGLIVVLMLAIVGVGRFMGGNGSHEFPPAAVETVVAAKQSVPVTIAALGTLEADQSIVVSPEIDGIVTSIDFTDGQRLKQGDTIITLDSDSLKARLMQTQARVTLTRANYDRASRLRKQGSGTERALDEALNDMRSAEADLASAQADLNKATIKAAFSGTVGLRQVSLGQYLKAGAPIATLADVDHLRIDFRVSEVFLTRIEKDQEVGVSLDALPGQTFKGTITAIDPVVDVSGRALSVRAVLANEGGRLRPGLFGRVNIVTLTRNSVVLPEAAIVPQQTGGKAVYVVVEDAAAADAAKDAPRGHHSELRLVEIGERLPGQVEILSGVEPGDVVVTAGQLKLRDGAPVAPVSDVAKEAAPTSTPKG
jgi:membrane fusion protein (multidrug efflux system)